MKPVVLVRGLLAALLCSAAAGGANAQPDFANCIDSLRRELPQHPKLRVETFEQHTRQAQDLRPPIDAATRSQPEFQLQVWDYLARLVDAKRVQDGRELLRRDTATLAAVTRQRGVDAATLVAILGVESDFGRIKGRYSVVDATLSRACLALDSKERKAHFFAALWLLQEGLVEPEGFRGSWAGAFGMTQFMPGTFVRYMADGDADGRIDIGDNLADALATSANYLNSLGWTAGLPWGIEVNAPADIARLWNSSEREHACLARTGAGARAGGRCRRLAEWAALGVGRVDGRPLAASTAEWPALDGGTPMALLTPAGADGPAWLVTRNFQALWSYNQADAYALAIGLLASELRDEAPMRAAWPGPEAGMALSRAGITALQELLVQGGQCALVVDGHDGPATRQAIRNEERRRGLLETGRPTSLLLELLRANPPAAGTAPCAAAPAASEAAPARTDPAPSPLPVAPQS